MDWVKVPLPEAERMAIMDAMDTLGKITPSDLVERQKSRWMMASTGLNGLLSIAKIGWGVYSGSTIVIADAVHSISDVLGALLILAAIRFSRHRSLRFPYGLHKVEDMAALGGAMLVVVAAYEIARAVFFSGGAQPPHNPMATMGFMTAVLVAEKTGIPSDRGIGAGHALWDGAAYSF
ncbi:MAG: cation transporter [Gammaproteobacteria bacterium]|nr:cation transporter [Gammaproteobacteria bacterium]